MYNISKGGREAHKTLFLDPWPTWDGTENYLKVTPWKIAVSTPFSNR